jgi:hypothetical protein
VNELKIEQAEAIEAPVLAATDFTDELSDEALDRATAEGACTGCSSPATASPDLRR